MSEAPAPGWRVRRVRADEAERLRAIRLAALADAPDAFGSTYADSAALPTHEWVDRARRQATGTSRATFVVELDDGRWAGMTTVLADGRADAWIVSVFVAPDVRGSGASRALLRTALAWSVDEAGAHVARLHVHEANHRARALYQRLGFRPTGRSQPHPHGDGDELELELQLEAGTG